MLRFDIESVSFLLTDFGNAVWPFSPLTITPAASGGNMFPRVE